LVDHLRPGRNRVFKNTENIWLSDFGDRQLRNISTPGHRRGNARIDFDGPIRMSSHILTDTVRMGGSYVGGVWQRDSADWTPIIHESQMAWGDPGIVYPERWATMQSWEREQQHRLIISTPNIPGHSDTIIDGVSHDWVNLSDLLALTSTVSTGTGNIQWRPAKELAIRIPTGPSPKDGWDWAAYISFYGRIDATALFTEQGIPQPTETPQIRLIPTEGMENPMNKANAIKSGVARARASRVR